MFFLPQWSVCKKNNQPGGGSYDNGGSGSGGMVATAVQHYRGSAKWKWLEKIKKVNNHLEVAAAVVAWQQLPCNIVVAEQNGSG